MFRSSQRPLGSVPAWIYMLFVLTMLLQIFFHALQPLPVARAKNLPSPPPVTILQVFSLGEPVTMAKLLMLWLQAFDYQSGVSIRFADLEPNLLQQWLSDILLLDPQAAYPLLAASRFYADIANPITQRIMSEFVYDEFLKNPDQRWPWLGHVAIIAKHRLHDLPLALKYARALSKHAKGADVPGWVKQMEFIILEDMGELEAARLFIGGLLASGEVKSAHELHFLNERLQLLEKKAANSKQ